MTNNIFEKSTTDELIHRVSQLTPTTQNHWGKMDVAQMLAHCNVAYEMTYENNHPKPDAVVKFMLKLFAKPTVVGSKPYKKNGQTAPQFVMTDPKDFEAEKGRLIQYLKTTQELGEEHFHNREYHSFGRLAKVIFSAATRLPNIVWIFILFWFALQLSLAFSGFYQDSNSVPPHFVLVLLPPLLLILYFFYPGEVSSGCSQPMLPS